MSHAVKAKLLGLCGALRTTVPPTRFCVARLAASICWVSGLIFGAKARIAVGAWWNQLSAGSESVVTADTRPKPSSTITVTARQPARYAYDSPRRRRWD